MADKSEAVDESPDNKTSEIDHKLIPDNTFTMILKVHGKVWSKGGMLGDNIEQGMPDEDLDSALRAVNGAGVAMQRTLAVKCANKSEDYPLPGDVSIEEDLTPKVSVEETGILYIAGADIKAGQALHLNLDGRVEPIDMPKPEEKPASEA